MLVKDPYTRHPKERRGTPELPLEYKEERENEG